jgi:predicted negative regulator of RcsB-dependent stress response
MDHVVPPVINVAHKSRFDTISSSGPFNIITVLAVIVIAAVGFWLWRKWQDKSVKRAKNHVSFAKPVSQMAVAREPEPEVEEESESEGEVEEEDSKEE